MEDQTSMLVEGPKKKEADTKIFAAIFVLFVIVVLLIITQSTKILPHTMPNVPTGITAASAMTMTEFDKQLAKQMMDKDGDGRCDACGMPVDLCIDSGQLQCNMDSKSTIGLLGSQHIHADFKVYINSKPLDFSDKAHTDMMRTGQPVSSFIRVDSGAPAPEKTGDVLHMHATGVPLWMFFESISLQLPNEIKIYINGKEISNWRNYVFNDADKLLITDSAGSLNTQLDSITDFAKNKSPAKSSPATIVSNSDLPNSPIHWHLTLNIIINGKKVSIPAEIGMGPRYSSSPFWDSMMDMTNMHTHNTGNTIHWEVMMQAPQPEDLYLGNFFQVWGKTFNKDCIFEFCSGNGKTLKMFVNSKPNYDFDKYIIRDGDIIEITY